ncbi:hypothetical protein [Halobiforma nitratireducens]|uniref:hypothetical protein n=1 Tax=Halobiforma nitratireducens TaxID=130048 RepID=UPI00373AEDA3
MVIYGNPDSEGVLYEGPVVVHANGWLELEGNRLLSPSAVHHLDIYDESEHHDADESETTERGHDDGGGDDRTNRFSPR